MLGFIFNMPSARNRTTKTSNRAPSHPLLTQSSSWAVSTTAFISSDIEPGQVGRMRYLATDWNAKAVENEGIPAGTAVIPLQRQGNTWLVMAVTDQTNQQAAA